MPYKKIVVFGGSFNPPGRHHIAIVEKLAKAFDKVIVVPCGPRPDKETVGLTQPIHRAVMVDLAFGNIPRVTVDLFDLEQSQFTRHIDLEKRYFPEGKIFFAVGSDLIKGGAKGESEIQTKWFQGEKLWKTSNFVLLDRKGGLAVKVDQPPNYQWVGDTTGGSSTEIREAVFRGDDVENLVSPKVAKYIKRHGLYRGVSRIAAKRLNLDQPKPMLVSADPMDGEMYHLPDYSAKEANCIMVLGGDGSMLHAIRRHWRKRLPFFGVNLGHSGFLLNEPPNRLDFTDWACSVLSREMSLVHAPLLYVEADGRRNCAFNDAWIERASGQAARLRISVNGEVRIKKLVADGILAATAAGSTAYANAMGAKALPVGTPIITLVGNNTMSPKWQMAHLPMDSEIVIESLESDKRPVKAFVDGVDLGKVKRFMVRMSRIAAAEIAFIPENDLATKLAKVQFPNEED